jgi:argininosuccinate lyase
MGNISGADKKLWGGRFAEKQAGITEKLSSSIQFDSRLYRQDIRGSKAHACMLERMGILSSEERASITGGLDEILHEIEAGALNFPKSLKISI